MKRMAEGPLDEQASRAVAMTRATARIVELLAPLSRAHREAVLRAAIAQCDADIAAERVERLFATPSDGDARRGR